jgi:hypothetical protein
MKAVIGFVAGILSVIAVGVLLIAYSLFNPRVATVDAAALARPTAVSDRVVLGGADDIFYGNGAAQQLAYPVNSAGVVRAVPAVQTYPAPVRTATVSRPVVYRDRPVQNDHSVGRSAGRDWKKTAMVIGGSTAAGAGVGAIFGGKKGALIGAALGGGASTIYEVRK